MPVGKTLEFTYVSVKILATSRTGEVCFLSQSEPARFDVLKSRFYVVPFGRRFPTGVFLETWDSLLPTTIAG